MNAYIVETDLLRDNIHRLQGALSDGVLLWAVVKGDGYGLGIEPLTQILLAEGVTHFAVTEPSEAEAVRRLSDQAEILMLRPTCDPGVLERLVRCSALCTLSSEEDATVLSAVAQSVGCSARAHCKVDTGMGRYGFHPHETAKLALLYQLPMVSVEGIYTHFHSAFCSEKATRAQFARFQQVLAALQAQGIDPGLCHCCNSSAALKYPEMHLDAVRIGSGLLGRLNDSNALGLHRIGYAEASVDELHVVHKGQSAGYGAGWRARRDTTLAILPIGYYHGFAVEKGRDLFRLRDAVRGALSLLLAVLRRRQLTVTLHDRAFPVRGHVGMLHTAVDVTGSEVRQGDLARLAVNPLLQKGMPVEYR